LVFIFACEPCLQATPTDRFDLPRDTFNTSSNPYNNHTRHLKNHCLSGRIQPGSIRKVAKRYDYSRKINLITKSATSSHLP
jgi:hypothetical protein